MELKEGQIVNARVSGMQPYGAFVEMEDGKSGLVFIEDLSVVRIKSPKDRVKIGQEIQCKVKSIDKKTENVKNFQEGMTVKGIVRDTEKNKNGVFIEITPNLVGMTEYNENLQYGQSVDVCIKKIQPEKKKLKLTII